MLHTTPRMVVLALALVGCAAPADDTVNGGWLGRGGTMNVQIGGRPPWSVAVRDADLHLTRGEARLVVREAVPASGVRYVTHGDALADPDLAFDLQGGRTLRWRGTTFDLAGVTRQLHEGSTLVVEADGQVRTADGR